MPPVDIRKRLREIREEQQRVDALRSERDRLIRQGLEGGLSQRTLAAEAGLSKTRIAQIAGRKGGQ